MNVCNFTTPANLFHALRRQVKRSEKSPLIVMTPKSKLRHPEVISARPDFTTGGVQEIIPATADSATVKKLLFCSGKVFFDLNDAVRKDEALSKQVAVTRVEQYYPFPKAEIQAEMERYVNAESVAWVQEEPANMGAWTFIRPRLNEVLKSVQGDICAEVDYYGRREAASPSTGSAKVHQLEQESIVNRATSVE